MTESKAKRIDPIHKVPLQRPKTIIVNGKPREIDAVYKFVIDAGRGKDGKRRQEKHTCDTYREARAERARIIAERAAGTYVQRDRNLTVRAYFDEWLESKSTKKPTTVDGYRTALVAFLDEYGHLPLQDLDVPHLVSLRARMLSGELRRTGKKDTPLSARTVNYALTTITMALGAAMKRGLIARNVGEQVDRVDKDPDAGADRRTWQTPQVRTFLRAAAKDRLHAAFLLSALGLRRGEVTGLRWDDVDLTGRVAEARKLPKDTPSIAIVNNRVAARGTIHEYSPKGKGRRRVPYLPIPAVLVDALTALQLAQREEADKAGDAYGACPLCGLAHVVVNELGQPYRPEWFGDQFARLVRSAGLPPAPLHAARHAAASVLADLGVPDIAAAAWLGHTKVDVTRDYQHVMTQRLAEASEALGGVFAEDV